MTEKNYDTAIDTAVAEFRRLPHDDYGLNHLLGDVISRIPMEYFNNDQEQFNQYLFFTKNMSWDIDGALGHYCEADPAWDSPDIMYRPRPEDPTDAKIIAHFKDIHGLNLLDENIDWSFDT